MAPKRKSDALEQTTLDPVVVLANSREANVGTSKSVEPAAKKARVADASTSKGKSKAKGPVDWNDVALEGEDEACVFPLIYIIGSLLIYVVWCRTKFLYSMSLLPFISTFSNTRL